MPGPSIFESISTELLRGFDDKDRAREEALLLSRKAIRLCSSSIRSVHRGEIEAAERLIGQAGEELEKIQALLVNHQDVRYAGFVDGSEQEYAEALSVYYLITRHEILRPDEIGVERVNYLAGLGDGKAELRRNIIDIISSGREKWRVLSAGHGGE